MSAHNILQEMQLANFEVVDGATGSTYALDRNFQYIPIVTGSSGETRTLAAPTRAGQRVLFSMKTDGGGDCVITVTGGYDEAGSTTLTFANVGETIELVSVVSTGTTYAWRVVFNDGVAGPAIDISVGTLSINGTEVTATAAELNMAADNSANVETVITTNVISASESGKTFFLDLVDGFASTLPAPAAGLRYTFIVKTAPTTAYTVATNSAAQILAGQVYCSAGTDEDSETGVTATTITFVANTAVIGDSCEVISDGTSWYAKAFCNATGGITITG
jgi:hypothetical protein